MPAARVRSATSEEPYSDRFIAEIIAEFQIPAEHAAKLKFCLQQAAKVYLVPCEVPDSTEQQLFQTRRGLDRVDKTYSAFEQSIEALSHHARDRLWHPAFSDPIRRRVPLAMAQYDSDNYPDANVFRRTLDAFGERIRERLDDFPHVALSSGRPRNRELQNWVGLIARIWTEVLKRKFTYSQMPKKRSTFEFCSRVLQRIDADVEPFKLKTAIRAAIPRRKPEKRTASRLRKRQRP